MGSETAESFSKYLSGITSSAFTSLSILVGHKTGLFKLFTTFDGPKTIPEIANIGGYKERYVQEWLGAMVTAKIVDHDPDRDTFFLPAHRHQAVLTRIPGFLGLLHHCVSGVDHVKECFKEDGPKGVPYSKYADMDGFFGDMEIKNYTNDYINKVFAYVPGLISGLKSGISMMELGCNVGNVTIKLGDMYPKSKITGVDYRKEPVAAAKAKQDEKNLTNVDFEAHDACNLPKEWTEKFDFVLTINVIHDTGSPVKALRELHRVLKPGGHAAIQDINMHTKLKDNMGDPKAPMMYSISLASCMPMSLSQEGGEGLGTAWGKEQAVALMKEAGFQQVEIKMEEPVLSLFVCKK